MTDREIAPTRRLSPAQLAAQQRARPTPALTAAALLVYDVDADRVLYARAMDDARPVASLTKLMTALLVLEEGSLADAVTIQAADLIGGAAMGLAAGDTLTVEELLWGLLIPSGNDAAMALARHVGGSVDGFVARMNERAAELGLETSNFRNPHGFDADDHVSSLTDLLILTQRNRAFPLFREIVATARTTVAGYDLRSTNELLTTLPDTVGVKTGTTPAAGQCLIAEIVRDGHPAIVAVLGSSDRYEDVRRLHDHYRRNYVWLDATTVSLLDRLYDQEGRLWYLEATGTAPSALVRRGDYASLHAYRRITLPPGVPWRSGLQVGTLEWRLGDTLAGAQPLILQ